MKIADIRKWDPCLESQQLINDHADDELKPIEILKTPLLAGRDDWRLWVVLREELIDKRTLRLFACDCAERALRKTQVKDKRCWQAIKIARKYAEGKATGAELNAARDAARDAAWNAARDAARDAEGKWQVKHLTTLLANEDVATNHEKKKC